MTNRDKLRRQRAEYERQIVEAIRGRADRTYAEIGAKFGVTAGRIAQLAVKFGARRRLAKGEN